jgi:hypothetical protein
LNPPLPPTTGDTNAVRNSESILTLRKKARTSHLHGRRDARPRADRSNRTPAQFKRLSWVYDLRLTTISTSFGEGIERCPSASHRSDMVGNGQGRPRLFRIHRQNCLAVAHGPSNPRIHVSAAARLSAGGWHIDQYDGGVGQRGPRKRTSPPRRDPVAASAPRDVTVARAVARLRNRLACGPLHNR